MRTAFRIATVSLLFAFSAGTVLAQDGTLRIATPIIAPRLSNPYPGVSLPSTIAILPIFDPLVVIDAKGEVRPWLATSWASTDALRWTINLRSGVTFSDGSPFNAAAVVASGEYLQTPKGKTTTIGNTFVNLERVIATGPLSVDIILQKPDVLFPQRLSNWKIPEPKMWAAKLDDEWNSKSIGTGPFMMTEENPARLVMVANPRAWNKPKAAKLELSLLQEQMTRMQAIAADAIDIALQIGPGDREELRALRGQALNRVSTRISYVSFATEHRPQSPINNPKVRLAMNYAVNRQVIADVLLGGTVTPVGQLVLPGAPGYVADIKPFPYDPTRAKALLAEAGYAKGLKLSVRLAPSGADDANVYQQIALDLSAVGINLAIIPAPITEMTRMMFKGDFEADMFSNFGRGLDGLGDYRYRSCIGETGIYKPYFCDPQNLEVVKLAQVATDLKALDDLMQKVTRREYESPPGIFLWQNNYLDGAGPRIDSTEGYDAYYDFIPLHNISVRK